MVGEAQKRKKILMVREAQKRKKRNSHGGGSTKKKNFQPLNEWLTPFTINEIFCMPLSCFEGPLRP
jgi:hypothetical protein